MADVDFLVPVHHRTGQPIETVYQMKVRTIAEPGLITRSAAACYVQREERGRLPAEGDREGHTELANASKTMHSVDASSIITPRTTAPTFTQSSLDELPDIVKSSEYFGSGAGATVLSWSGGGSLISSSNTNCGVWASLRFEFCDPLATEPSPAPPVCSRHRKLDRAAKQEF